MLPNIVVIPIPVLHRWPHQHPYPLRYRSLHLKQVFRDFTVFLRIRWQEPIDPHTFQCIRCRLARPNYKFICKRQTLAWQPCVHEQTYCVVYFISAKACKFFSSLYHQKMVLLDSVEHKCSLQGHFKKRFERPSSFKPPSLIYPFPHIHIKLKDFPHCWAENWVRWRPNFILVPSSLVSPMYLFLLVKTMMSSRHIQHLRCEKNGDSTCPKKAWKLTRNCKRWSKQMSEPTSIFASLRMF